MYAGGGVGSGIGSGAGGRGVGSGIDGSGTGSGTGGTGVSTSSSQVGTCSTVDSCGSSAGSGASSPACCSCCFCAASVARKSSASGPSRMLARFRAIEHLLCEVAVEGGGVAAGVVTEHRLSLHGRFGVAHGLADLGVEDEVAEVLFQDVDSFLRVQEALVEHRRQDPLD